jgi:O-antigen/teichoic acid export membrane protein
MLPVFTRYLRPADYGIVAISQVLISLIVPFAGLTIHGWLVVNYHNKSHEEFSKNVMNGIMILFFASIIISLIIYVFAEDISKLASFPIEWLWAVVLIAITQCIIQVTLSLWQIQVQPTKYGFFQIMQSLVNVSLSIWFVVSLGMNWQGRLMAQVITGILFGTTGLLIIWKQNWLTFRIDFSLITSALKFGVPIIPHELAGWVLAATDRLFIIKMVGVAETGIYAVGYQVAMIITLIEMSFNTAWIPWLYKRLSQKNDDDKIKIVKFTYLYVITVIIFSVALSLSAPWFLNIFIGKAFNGSIQFIIWLALGKAIYSMYFMTCNYIFFTKKTVYISLATFSSALIHILTTYLLVKYNGAIGAAQAGIISTLFLVCITWFLAQRVYKMPWLMRI